MVKARKVLSWALRSSAACLICGRQQIIRQQRGRQRRRGRRGIAGLEHANKSAQSGNIIGYRQQEVCQTNRVVHEEVVEKVVGYRIKVEADGRFYLEFEQGSECR